MKKTNNNNKIILDKLIDSCLYFDADLFLPHLHSETVTVAMPNKTNFHEFFEQMLLSAKDNSIEPMRIKIEIPSWEEDDKIKHYKLYDSVHKYSRLCISVRESDDQIDLDIIPF
jgi:hypothetical protein